MTEPTEKSIWRPILPVPDSAPAHKTRHWKYGDPHWVYEYRDLDGRRLGFECLFYTSTGERSLLPLTWCQDQHNWTAWKFIQFQRMRPIYGLETLGLFAHTEEELAEAAAQGETLLNVAELDVIKDVFICFDAHAARCARQLLPWATAISWPGGLPKIDEVDWSLLRGKQNVWIWPCKTAERVKVRRDHEGEGAVLPRDKQSAWKAVRKLESHLVAHGCQILGVIDPFSDEQTPVGFDAGMAVTLGWTEEQTQEWVLGHLLVGPGRDAIQKRWAAQKGAPDPLIETVPDATKAVAGKVARSDWESDLLYQGGALAVCTANIADILLNAPEWRGVLGYDDFEKKTVKLAPPPFQGGEVGEWDDSDDTWTSMWMAKVYGFTPSSKLVSEAVEAVAKRMFKFNPVQDYLNGLAWDGVGRIDDWLTDFLGVEPSEYSRLVGRFFLMGMIARAMNPGGQWKYCMILEGTQDAGKSKALGILGGKWFGDSDLDLNNKDSMVGIQGKWLYEFAELDSLSRAESSKAKSFLSRRNDEFRPHYGRRLVKCPRQTAFAGSVNEFEYLKDPSGAVRFWPVLCGEIDAINHAGLEMYRDQLFAEAYVRWRSGERYWPTPEQQRELFDPQQFKRQPPDNFVDRLYEWVHEQVQPFTQAMALSKGLGLDPAHWTPSNCTKCGIALTKLGCKKIEKRNGTTRFMYEPPKKVAGYSHAPSQPASSFADSVEQGGGYAP